MSQKLTSGVKTEELKRKRRNKNPILIFFCFDHYLLFLSLTRSERETLSDFGKKKILMGCCQSLCSGENPLGKDGAQPQPLSQNHHRGATAADNGGIGSGGASGVGGGGGGGGIPSFSEFSFADLKAATNNFSSDNIVSESGEKAPNLVYKGRLQNRRWIAVKKFTKLAWPEPKQFAVIQKNRTF